MQPQMYHSHHNGQISWRLAPFGRRLSPSERSLYAKHHFTLTQPEKKASVTADAVNAG
jgi:hypothetical protein